MWRQTISSRESEAKRISMAMAAAASGSVGNGGINGENRKAK